MKKPEKILANDLLELEVLDLGAGQILGSIVDFALTREGKVALLGILSEQWYLGGKGIAPASITNVNNDRITIANADALTEFCPDGTDQFAANSDTYFRNKTVLLDDGEMLGALMDFSFNLDDGQITDLIVLGDDEKRVRVPVESFETVGRDYIVIVRGAQSFEDEEVPAPTEAEPVAEPAAKQDSAPVKEDASVDIGIPPIPEHAVEVPAPSEMEPTREQEKKALFGNAKEKIKLSKFDEKKRDFLAGKTAHRDINDPDGNPIVAKDQTIDDTALEHIISAGMLGDVFIELTLKK